MRCRPDTSVLCRP